MRKVRSVLAQQTNSEKKGRIGLRKCLDPPLLAAQYVEVDVAGYTYRVLKSEHTKLANYKKEFEEISLQRLAAHSRADDILVEKKQWEDKLATYEAELKSINESTKSIAKNRGNEYMYVDSSITHGAPQRMEISEARAELQAKISEANSHMAVLHMEEEAILQAIKLRAVVHLQKTYKMKRRGNVFLYSSLSIEKCFAKKLQFSFKSAYGCFLAAKVLAALALARRRRLGAIQIQRVFRGLVARKVYARMVDAALRRARKRATVRIQTIVRMRRASTLLAGMRQRAALLAAMRRKAAAINIQRMVRGWIAKRRKYARRVELSLGPRIRELCARFIAKGDLYGFLEAVNADFEFK